MTSRRSRRLSTPALLTTTLMLLSVGMATGGELRWIHLSDKGRHEGLNPESARSLCRVADRARSRRLIRGREAGLQAIDLPLEPSYLEALRARGLTLRVESRWLNAVSVEGEEIDWRGIEQLPFVDRVRRVAAGILRKPESRGRSAESTWAGRADYGASAGQLEQIGVPALHDLGLSGAGVLVGVLDSGFCLEHPAFANLDFRGGHSFTRGDSLICDPLPPDPDQNRHGTQVLSTLAGWAPGELIGPAHGAAYFLAATETIGSEAPVEEDRWVAGIEWLEAMGCDLVNSSLGYTLWYELSDLDGDTAACTIAADLAVELGMVVVNSAGNWRQDHGRIGAPADGDGVIAVGAVDHLGYLAHFSSPGPTWDDRIKPDLVARGLDNPVVDGESGYGQSSGTSHAAPLMSGLVALLLEAVPTANPSAILTALRLSADQADAPDNDFGWGLPDGELALAILRDGVPVLPDPSYAFRASGPNPFIRDTYFSFSLERKQVVRLDIFDAGGRWVKEILNRPIAAGEHHFPWDGNDAEGLPAAAGVYLASFRSGGHQESAKAVLLY